MNEKDVCLAALQRQVPHTFESMQHLIMSMDDYVKSMGKRTIFGKEKAPAAYEKYLQHLQRTVLALQRDGQVAPGASPNEIILKLRSVMALFKRAFPNWPNAYMYFEWSTTEDKSNAVGLITLLVG
ncbi:hypothetical protein [Comamonas sp. B-9]|uniref:hypothetical protein n=1 Tax=Comamonas sp. B-9 TaxID=1055192 RepID=UPI000395726A|nr:hypothetical protein [Comamonas sp. B-9]